MRFNIRQTLLIISAFAVLGACQPGNIIDEDEKETGEEHENENGNHEDEKISWPVSSYNFGGLEDLSAVEQISLLRNAGYQGIIVRTTKDQNFLMLPDFLEEADKYDDFQVSAIFVRYNFDDPVEKKERWTEAVDQIAGKNIQLWVIFGKPVEGYGDTFIEEKLREIVEYSTARGIEVVLYPHSTTYIESAEEGLPFVEMIDHDSLKICFHLYHEIRAHNGSRIHEVLDIIKSKLGTVTIAGTDSIADYSSALARDTSTIKPLGQGNYDMEKFTQQLSETGYSGYVGLMNFKMEGPEIYLPKSLSIWESYVSSLEGN